MPADVAETRTPVPTTPVVPLAIARGIALVVLQLARHLQTLWTPRTRVVPSVISQVKLSRSRTASRGALTNAPRSVHGLQLAFNDPSSLAPLGTLILHATISYLTTRLYLDSLFWASYGIRPFLVSSFSPPHVLLGHLTLITVYHPYY